jgi:hypothetical protein
MAPSACGLFAREATHPKCEPVEEKEEKFVIVMEPPSMKPLPLLLLLPLLLMLAAMKTTQEHPLAPF